jgi:glucosylceramidase
VDSGDFHWWMDNQSIGAVNMGPTGTTGALGWNLCLDVKNGPQNGIKDGSQDNGGCTTCRGMVQMNFSEPEPTVRYNGEFYALAQLSRFIVPGSRRVELKGELKDVNAVPIENPDGSMVFAVQNQREEPARIRFRLPNCKYASYVIPAQGAVTFRWAK